MKEQHFLHLEAERTLFSPSSLEDDKCQAQVYRMYTCKVLKSRRKMASGWNELETDGEINLLRGSTITFPEGQAWEYWGGSLERL